MDVEKLIILVGPQRFSAMFSSKLEYVAKISTDMIVASAVDPVLIILVGPQRFSARFSSKLEHVAKISTDMIIAPAIDPVLIVLMVSLIR